ncbi:hypothetical protein TCAP_02505, partial [Tolypocladium capitatum]
MGCHGQVTEPLPRPLPVRLHARLLRRPHGALCPHRGAQLAGPRRHRHLRRARRALRRQHQHGHRRLPVGPGR